MRLPNPHRSGTLLALAILLAMTTTGYITICDVFLFGEPEDGPTLFATVEAGETAVDVTGSSDGFFYRFSLCSPVPQGVYPVIRRDGTSFGSPVQVDIVTSTNTPPGFYTIDYNEGDIGFFSDYFAVGQLELTVEQPTSGITVCMFVGGKGEFVVVNEPATLYACCSTGPKDDPIVQYRWWPSYNGNPSSSPTYTTGECIISHTYTTTGTKTARLVLRTESGEEAEGTVTVQVVEGR